MIKAAYRIAVTSMFDLQLPGMFFWLESATIKWAIKLSVSIIFLDNLIYFYLICSA